MQTQPRFLHLLFLLGILTGCQTIEEPETSVTSGFDNLLDSVVRIDVRETNFDAGNRRTQRGVGSGVIMSAEGHILTNAHVVNPQAEEILVTLASLERVNAHLIGWDHWTDLALLQLDLAEIQNKDLTFSRASFGESNKLTPGSPVFAVGTPNGLTRTVTKGIISNTNRFFEGSASIKGFETGYFSTWLQTDAAINPGNSGGPLVTSNGAVIGINTRGYLGSNNLGFAVPSSTARVVMAALLDGGKVKRSYIGLKPGPLQDLETFYGLEANRGMLVNSVDPGSPADKAGLKPSDIVLKIDGENVDGRFPEQLPPIGNKIASYPVDSVLSFIIKRGDETVDLKIKTEELVSRVGEKWAFDDWGMTVEKVSRAVARERKLESENGVLVVGTQQAFPADESGLNKGDIITQVNRTSIDSLDVLKNVYDQFIENPDEILLEVHRGFRVSYYVLKPR